MAGLPPTPPLLKWNSPPGFLLISLLKMIAHKSFLLLLLKS